VGAGGDGHERPDSQTGKKGEIHNPGVGLEGNAARRARKEKKPEKGEEMSKKRQFTAWRRKRPRKNPLGKHPRRKKDASTPAQKGRRKKGGQGWGKVILVSLTQ